MTRLRFFFDYALKADGSRSDTLWRSNEVLDEIPGVPNPYSMFLAAFLYGLTRPDWIAEVEERIRQLENGELSSFDEATEGHFAIFSAGFVEVGALIRAIMHYLTFHREPPIFEPSTGATRWRSPKSRKSRLRFTK